MSEKGEKKKMKLLINKDYVDPEKNNIEVVERKGIGHPDTLADKLAEECSRVYASYCYNKYGVILHYNFDKLYIGAGLFKYDNSKIKKYSNIVVNLNGRASNTINGEKIDIDGLLKPVIKKYLKSVMPRLDVENDVTININCTQNTKREYWYTPRNVQDVPDYTSLNANDTSLCVSNGGYTYCEQLALKVEQSFWNYTEDGYATPKFSDIGQDIKVMVTRINKDIDLSISLPVFKDKFNTDEEFANIIKKYEDLICSEVAKIDNPMNYKVSIGINKMPDGSLDKYSLVIGSCCECGEEGVVGRGNNSQGIISALRPHTMEAACGKNMRYHTGCVLSFLGNRVSQRIFEEENIHCTLYCMTRNKNPLLAPYLFYLSVDKDCAEERINKIIEEEFNENFVDKILEKRRLF